MVDLRPDQLEIVKAVLKAEVPKAEVWAFGSRASWTARDTSDLDLVLVGERALPYRTIARLRRAFEESYLPFSVDVVDWRGVSEDFRAIILAQKVVIQAGSSDGSGQLEERRWRSVPLAECANFLSGGTPPKGVPDYWNGDIPWVSAKDMKIFRLFDTLEHVTPEGVSNGTRLVPAGTVLVLVRGMTLHSDVPICITRRPMAFNQDVRALRPRPEVDSDYLAYALLANKPALLSMVDSASHGTGRIHSGALASFPMALPSLPEQRAIAHVLGTLDDRIDLNRRMNQTLEAMARAIFKAWFTYQPSEGRDVADIYSFGDVIYGAPFSSALFNNRGEGKPLIRIRDLESQAPSIFTPETPAKARLAEAGDILVGMDGEFKAWLWGGPPAWVNQRICLFKPKPHVPRAFLLYSLEEPLSFFERSKSGTTVIHLGKADIDTFRFPLPDPQTLHKFTEITEPMLNRIILNQQESRTLANLRDTLLPKLLSGEIRVKQAEKMVGEAV